jgi:multiple sugar transport system substrate-binding protein
LLERGIVTAGGVGLGPTLLAACGGDDEGAAKGQFKGVTVRVVTLAGGPVGEVPLTTIGKQWERRTGANIEIQAFPFGQVFQKIRSSLRAQRDFGDLWHILGMWAGDLMGGGVLEPVPEEIKARLDLDDVLPGIRRIHDWSDVQYGVPYDGDNHMLNYRKDVLQNPAYRERFKSEFSYDLPRPPQTWGQFLDISNFFTGWDWGEAGARGFGESIGMARGGGAYFMFMGRAAAYSKVPDDPAFFFDPDTMEPLIANPGFVRALTEWKDELGYGTPGMINQSFLDARTEFTSGKALFNYEWADIGTLSIDPKTSRVKDKVGFSPQPGSNQVYNHRTKRWQTFEEVSDAPYLAANGWIQVVPKSSRHKEAAWDLAVFMGTQPRATELAVLPGSGVNPNRESQLRNIEPWLEAGFDQASAGEYLDAIRKILGHDNAVQDLRIPAVVDYQDALESRLSSALAGRTDPASALADAAKAWDDITDRVGRDEQLNHYRKSLGLI